MLQYVPYLRPRWSITIAPFFDDEYLSALYEGRLRLRSVVAGFLRRIGTCLRMKRFELAWVEAELLPWIPWAVERVLADRVSLALDYDDAVFHRYDAAGSPVVRALLGGKVARLMRRAGVVIAGNRYIASYAEQAGARHVEIVPTVLDTARYRIAPAPRSPQLTIGWIGTPKTQHYLQTIEGALHHAHRALDARIVAIGAHGTPLRHTPVEVRAWDERTEAAELAAIDVGIMPLIDSPWERGKCGYKLLQYMASGKPVVASPVGANRDIVEHGRNGYLASSIEEWIHAFQLLQADRERASAMGHAGREKVERDYSLVAVAPRVHGILDKASAG